MEGGESDLIICSALLMPLEESAGNYFEGELRGQVKIFQRSAGGYNHGQTLSKPILRGNQVIKETEQEGERDRDIQQNIKVKHGGWYSKIKHQGEAVSSYANSWRWSYGERTSRNKNLIKGRTNLTPCISIKEA